MRRTVVNIHTRLLAASSIILAKFAAIFLTARRRFFVQVLFDLLVESYRLNNADVVLDIVFDALTCI